MPIKVFDILIAGFGPAGVVCALHLKKLGADVALVGALKRTAAFEGLAPRTLEGLRRAGLDAAIATATIDAARTASWNGVSNAANREFLIDRQDFDRALMQDCRAAGIPLYEGRVSAALQNPAHTQVKFTLNGVDETIAGRFFVEARGRRAPHRGVAVKRGPQALSLSRRLTGLPPSEAQTCLQSYADGWSWFARTTSGAGVIQLVVSANRPELGRKMPPASLFAKEMAKLPHLEALLRADVKSEGPVIVRESSAILNDNLAGLHGLRVGDAAFAIDPLSGHGNFEAVGGAMAAATVINTLFARPENSELALRFYKTRAEAAFLRHARVGRDFYRMETQWPDAPFWRERQDWPDHEPAHEAAFSAPAYIAAAPVIENGFIVERPVIITADQPRGIRMVDSVAVPELLDMLQKGGPEATPEALCRSFKVSPSQLSSAFSWLKFRGLLPAEK